MQALSKNSGASLGYGFPIGESAAKDGGTDNKENSAVKASLDETTVVV